MSYIFTGFIHMTVQQIEIAPDVWRREIVDARWQGPPIALIAESLVRELPVWAVAHGGQLIQIGPYVLRRTPYQYWPARGSYWVLAGSGDMYWHFWRLMQWLSIVGSRVVLTLAVWHLAEWPPSGTYPTWSDVMRRWRNNE